MKGFFIEVTNYLLEPKHRKKMGTAVWEFMWCLDKITRIDEEQIGWVYGGKPINLIEVSEEIGLTESKISKNLNKLKKEGYLDLIRTPNGLIVKVYKAKKRFAHKDMGFAHKDMGFAHKVKSNIIHNNNNISNNAKQFDSKIEIDKLLTNEKRRDIQIVGLFFKETGITFDNYNQYQNQLRRHLRAAKNLIGYSNEDISETINVLKSTEYIKRFTLETISKYIDDVRKELKKTSSRPILKWEEIKQDGKISMRPVYAEKK